MSDFFQLDDIDTYIEGVMRSEPPSPPKSMSTATEITDAKSMKKAGAEAAVDIADTASDVTRAMTEGYQEVARAHSASSALATKAADAQEAEARKTTQTLIDTKKAYDANVERLDANINNPASLRNKAGTAFVEASIQKLDILDKLAKTANRETTGVFDWLKRGFEVDALKQQAGAVDMKQQAAAGVMATQTNLLTAEGANLKANMSALDNDSVYNSGLIASVALRRQAEDSKAAAVGTGIQMVKVGWDIGTQRATLLMQAGAQIMSTEQFQMQREVFQQNAKRVLADENMSAQSYQFYLEGLRVAGADTTKALDLDNFKRYAANKDANVAQHVARGMMSKTVGIERIAGNVADVAAVLQDMPAAFNNNPTARAYADFVLSTASARARMPDFKGQNAASQQQMINTKVENEFIALQNDADKSPMLKSPGPLVIGKSPEIQKDKWFQRVYGTGFEAGNAAELTPSHLLKVTQDAILYGELTPTEATQGIKKYFDAVGYQNNIQATRFALPNVSTYNVQLDGTTVGSSSRIDLRSNSALSIIFAKFAALRTRIEALPARQSFDEERSNSNSDRYFQ